MDMTWINDPKRFHELTDFLASATQEAYEAGRREASSVLRLIQNCEPDEMTYMSNPPQNKCKRCGKFWFVGSNPPACEVFSHPSIEVKDKEV